MTGTLQVKAIKGKDHDIQERCRIDNNEDHFSGGNFSVPMSYELPQNNYQTKANGYDSIQVINCHLPIWFDNYKNEKYHCKCDHYRATL